MKVALQGVGPSPKGLVVGLAIGENTVARFHTVTVPWDVIAYDGSLAYIDAAVRKRLTEIWDAPILDL